MECNAWMATQKKKLDFLGKKTAQFLLVLQNKRAATILFWLYIDIASYILTLEIIGQLLAIISASSMLSALNTV